MENDVIGVDTVQMGVPDIEFRDGVMYHQGLMVLFKPE